MKNFIVNIVIQTNVSVTHSDIDEEKCRQWAEDWARNLDEAAGNVTMQIEVTELKDVYEQ